MALIKCAECGADISDSAEFCPHCGYRGEKNERQEIVTPQTNPTQKQYGQQYFNPDQREKQNNNYYYDNRQADGALSQEGDDCEFYRKSPSTAKVNVFGIIGLVLAIVSLFLALWGIVAIVGLVFSILGLVYGNQMKEKKTGLALSAIILNSISILYTVCQLLTIL